MTTPAKTTTQTEETKHDKEAAATVKKFAQEHDKHVEADIKANYKTVEGMKQPPAKK